MRRLMCALLIVLFVWPVFVYAGDCSEGFTPDVRALKKLQPQFQVGDQIIVGGKDNPTNAEVVKIVPWWDSSDCVWKVNYQAEVKNVFTFAEGDANVRLAGPRVGK